jgi:hypothetical protein
MMKDVDTYGSLSDSLAKLPVLGELKIGKYSYPIPQDLDTLSQNICYGQRLFLLRNEPHDFGLIVRLIDGYFYPIVTREKWDDNKALLFGKKVINCTVKDLYPVAMHITILLSELAVRETKLLNREPSKLELAAGIDKLAVFSELSAIDFLRQSLNKTEDEVMLTPYNECLVRFMQAKEVNAYHDRYMKLAQEENKPKPKHK